MEKQKKIELSTMVLLLLMLLCVGIGIGIEMRRVSWLRRLGGDAEIGEFVWYFSLLVERITTCDLCV